jgi:hypothetical protein
MSDAATWAKALELYIDLGVGGNNPIATVTATTTSEGTAKPMVQGENRPVRLRFGTRSGATWVPYALELTDVIDLTGKAKATPAGILFFTDTFVLGGTSEDPYYDGTLALNGTSLNTAMATASLACLVDIRVVGTDGLKAVAQYELNVKRRVHEDAPLDPDELPNYLTETQSDARYALASQISIPTGYRLVVSSAGEISVVQIGA